MPAWKSEVYGKVRGFVKNRAANVPAVRLSSYTVTG